MNQQPNNDTTEEHIPTVSMRTSAAAVEDWLEKEAKRFPPNFIAQVRQYLTADLTRFLEDERTKSYIRGFRAGDYARRKAAQNGDAEN